MGEDTLEWPPSEADLLEVLDNLRQGDSESPSDFEMAVLGMLVTATEPMSVTEIMQRLREDYDAPPCRATITLVHARDAAKKEAAPRASGPDDQPS